MVHSRVWVSRNLFDHFPDDAHFGLSFALQQMGEMPMRILVVTPFHACVDVLGAEIPRNGPADSGLYTFKIQ